MAILFSESFDGQLSAAQLLYKWGTFTSVTLQPTNGRRGSGCAFWTFGTQAEVAVVSSSTSIVGIAINPLSPLTGVCNLIEWGDRGSSVQCRLRINTNRTIEMLRSGTATLGTSVALVDLDAYSYLEVKLHVANSPNGFFIVKLDGTEILNVSGVDTQGSGVSDTINSIDFGGNTGAGIRVDDLVILDDTGPNNNDFPGDMRVDTLVPLSDSAIVEFTTDFPVTGSHWDKVDESPVDEDTSYVQSSTGGHRDIFNFSALPVNPLPATVLAVQPWVWAKKQQTGPKSIRNLVQPVSTIYNQTTQGANAEDWKLVSQEILETNPETGVAWLESEVDAAKFGVEVV